MGDFVLVAFWEEGFCSGVGILSWNGTTIYRPIKNSYLTFSGSNNVAVIYINVTDQDQCNIIEVVRVSAVRNNRRPVLSLIIRFNFC